MKRYGWITIIAFFLIVTAVAVSYAAGEPSDWSKSENRELAQMPVWEGSSSDADEYMRGFEPFLNDQFPMREALIRVYTKFQMDSGWWYVRGVWRAQMDPANASGYYIGPEYLFLNTYRTGDAARRAYAKALKQLCSQSGVKVADIVLPHKNYALAEGSGGAFTNDLDIENLWARKEAASSAGAALIDACTPFCQRYGIEERAEMYFKSNTHWNPLGAYRASEVAAQEMAKAGLIAETSVPSEDAFIGKDLSDDHIFPEGLAERLGIEMEIREYIPVYMAAHPENWRYFTGLDKAPVKREDIVLRGIDDYELDYNKVGTRNLTYIRVENPYAPEDQRVLILKDSYQCATIDYFSSIFRSITVLDPRFELPPLGDYIRDENIDLILLMYHQNNNLEELSQYVEASWPDKQ
ncbi:MAG: hypothetical protein J6X24_08180 [Firmicutes bacterium]|nr:hypothetical protein [Bacillota bacterium]